MQAKSDYADVNKHIADVEIIAMQKLSFAQQQSRKLVEDVKDHQRQIIAKEAAKAMSKTKLTEAEMEARKQEQDALVQTHTDLDAAQKDFQKAKLNFAATQQTLRDQMAAFREQEKHTREIENGRLEHALLQMNVALKAEAAALQSVLKNLVSLHTNQVKQMNKTLGALQEHPPNGSEDLQQRTQSTAVALEDDVRELAAARIRVVTKLAEVKELSNEFHERRMKYKPILTLNLNHSRTDMENVIQTEANSTEPTDFDDSELLEIGAVNFPAATPSTVASMAVRQLFPFRLVIPQQAVPQSLSNLQPITAPEKPADPNAPPMQEPINDQEYPLSRLGVGRTPDRSNGCPCKNSPLANACKCGIPKPQCGCKPLQCDCGADDCKLSSSAAVGTIVGKSATVFMYDELRAKTARLVVPCDVMVATMSQQWSDAAHATGECIGIGGAPILPGDFVCGYFVVPASPGRDEGGKDDENSQDTGLSTTQPYETTEEPENGSTTTEPETGNA